MVMMSDITTDISNFRERDKIQCTILTLSEDFKFAIGVNYDSFPHTAPMSQ